MKNEKNIKRNISIICMLLSTHQSGTSGSGCCVERPEVSRAGRRGGDRSQVVDLLPTESPLVPRTEGSQRSRPAGTGCTEGCSTGQGTLLGILPPGNLAAGS